MTNERPSRPGTPATAPAVIQGVGTAVPETSYTQQELLEEFRIHDPRVRALFLNSAIERRNLTLPPHGPDGTRRPESQGELLAKHTRTGIALGREAVTAALASADCAPQDVAHLCCVTSTGFLTPGFSALLIKELGLSRHCSRLDVVGMGCNAGLNALASVSGWASTHPGELALMVCIEACSAAYVFDGTLRTSVVNSLFGDGAAALAVRAPAADGGHRSPAGGPALTRFSSVIIPEAVDAMRFDWDDEQGRFSFFLDPEVPYVVGAHAGAALDRLLAGTGLHPSDVAHWIVHSGGKKVVDAVRANLGLSRADVRHTTGVLRDHGNLSSGSFLFSYERLAAEQLAGRGDFGVLMTMGPGSTIEMALASW
ncbi:3,5-dihydroxyphenylacetyl-CoA synthase DpgA [Streptomyces sp. NPDC054884]|uniref:3,5-dihydroxyphenylacetyl-CoA synthase DpgA n=1 Tax=Streptomyces sp. ME08-AFT2 TaxID=3028683 RepID=UPI0029B5A345|nr:3,5-dihydroxyphenylacetyl-CoA synthase DpgA [Streptomyces sp. ME08-AFT2]MDX3312439.1 type III polyketide synthase [Streptomyces sp. ME08-AFT2]